jgi:CheY-like chemotaxis protein
MSARLLVVDDEDQICEMLSRHFRYLGYTVSTAANGLQALSILNETKVDVLVSDIMMPTMTGVELLKQVRAEFPMIRPIMITGHITLDNALACIRYGADSCIFKPLTDLALLERAVSDAVTRNRYWMNILRELRGLK